MELLKNFRAWLPWQQQLMAAQGELKGRTLGCWCKDASDPKPCHGDILIEMAQGLPEANGAPSEKKIYQKSSSILAAQEKNLRLPSGANPKSLLQHMIMHCVELADKDREAIYQVPDDLNPLTVKDFVQGRKIFYSRRSAAAWLATPAAESSAIYTFAPTTRFSWPRPQNPFQLKSPVETAH